MKLNKEDKNLIFYSVTLILSLVLFILTFQINSRGKAIAESPKLLPFITVGVMALISVIGIIEALVKQGRFKFKAIGPYLKDAFFSNWKTILSVAIVGVYIFCAIKVSFYISSFILIAAISSIYVKRLKIWWSILIAAGIVVALYLVFAMGFKLYLH